MTTHTTDPETGATVEIPDDYATGLHQIADVPQASPATSTPVTEPEKPSAEETLDSLTGYDEIAIEKAFGADIFDLVEKGSRYLRALVFVLKTRDGLSPVDARKAALGMRMGDVKGYFAEDTDELTPEEPVTEQGKDDSLSD